MEDCLQALAVVMAFDSSHSFLRISVRGRVGGREGGERQGQIV